MDLIELDYLSNNKYFLEKDGDQTIIKKEKKSFFHIDSSTRNKIPSNILDTQVYNLDTDSLSFTKGSNKVGIWIPNNTFNTGDSFILDNVSSNVLNTAFKLSYNNFYLIIQPPATSGIAHDFITNIINQYSPKFQISISDMSGDDNYLTDVDKKYLFGVIPLNVINSVFNFIVNKTTRAIKIKLPYALPTTAKNPSGVRAFTITSLNIATIPIGELNANYPLDKYHINGFHIIDSIINDYIYFLTTTYAIATIKGGGSNMIASKVIDRIISYPVSSFYQISLDKTYRNVTKIRVSSSEIPYTVKSITSSLNSLYLKFFTTANSIYSVTIPDGFYDETTLLNILLSSLNKINPGQFIFSLNSFVNLFFNIQSYRSVELYQPFIVGSNFTNLTVLNKSLSIVIPYHSLVTGDSIKIQNAISFLGIPANVLNSTFTITVLDTNTFSISLPNYNIDESSIGSTTNGGNNVIFLLPNPVLILGGENNINSLLGITLGTQYSNFIFNTTPLQIYPSHYLLLCCYINNFKDPTNYILTKIQFDGIKGSYLYDKHTYNFLEFDPPIKNLYSITIEYTFGNGKRADFLDFENSISLEIYESLIMSEYHNNDNNH